jgi:hypothetical protein
MDGMLRNPWILCFGFCGRHVPDLMDDFPRIMHNMEQYQKMLFPALNKCFAKNVNCFYNNSLLD